MGEEERRRHGEGQRETGERLELETVTNRGAENEERGGKRKSERMRDKRQRETVRDRAGRDLPDPLRVPQGGG